MSQREAVKVTLPVEVVQKLDADRGVGDNDEVSRSEWVEALVRNCGDGKLLRRWWNSSKQLWVGKGVRS